MGSLTAVKEAVSGHRPVAFADAQESDLLRLCVMKCLNLGTHADMHLPKPDGPSERGGERGRADGTIAIHCSMA